ncbi:MULTISPECIES: C2H2-type zinc finger protein [Streptomyces]|uniref:C2H2-type zinc finger protein n=1 Tax=Streptomyces flavovirens TaxID=52258 RepID=A0ABV8NEC1_9ACTN
MPQTMITIRPTPALRRAFAKWAVAQRPKIRTVSTAEFAVPDDLFVDVPEELLIGSVVDGHRYVSPVEDAELGAQPPARLLDCGTCYEENGEEVHPHPECPLPPEARPELVGVATEDGFREAVPGEPLPEVPAEAYPPDSVPIPAADPVEDTTPADEPQEGFPCPHCDKPFSSERGRDTHQRMKHPED